MGCEGLGCVGYFFGFLAISAVLIGLIIVAIKCSIGRQFARQDRRLEAKTEERYATAREAGIQLGGGS